MCDFLLSIYLNLFASCVFIQNESLINCLSCQYTKHEPLIHLPDCAFILDLRIAFIFPHFPNQDHPRNFYQEDWSKIGRILVHQRKRRIQPEQGFAASFKYNDPSDFGSLIVIKMVSNECTLRGSSITWFPGIFRRFF